MTHMHFRSIVIVLATGAVVVPACGGDDSSVGSTPSSSTTTAPSSTTTAAAAVIDVGDNGAYAPEIDPANFVSRIDNPYLPLLPGASWTYDGVSDGEPEHTEVVVTDQHKTVMGIDATVVRDTVSSNGEVTEDTFDWFAQDVDGNVWYLGEDTKEYENGEVVSTGGSWEAGVDGAQPGIVMQAAPAAGDAYRQEYYPGEAEDMAEVARLHDTVSVPYGTFDDALVITEWNPLEPDTVEEKYYAAGVGTVLEATVRGPEDRVELVAYQPGA